MSRDADQIRQEIEDTRGQLGDTLEAIGDRVSPRHVVEEIADKVSPRRLVRRQTEKVKEGLSGVGDSVRSKASNGTNGAASSVPRPRLPEVNAPNLDLRAREKAADVKDGVVDKAHGFSGRLRDVSATTAEQVRTAPENAPLVAGLVAFGAGLAVALAIPSTRDEREVAGSVATKVQRPLKATVTRTGRDFKAELEPTVRGGVEKVKRAASGMTTKVAAEADDIRTEVKSAARDVKGTTKREVSTAKSRVKATSTAGPRSRATVASR